MAVRIPFSTHWPDRMGDLAGQRTFFPEKILAMLLDSDEKRGDLFLGQYWDGVVAMQKHHYNLRMKVIEDSHPKITTIRSNYDYWKKFEGKMIQPFFWAGKPRRSKHVVFCPEVKLERVDRIEVVNDMIIIEEPERYVFLMDSDGIDQFARNEGFDSTEHFFRWFNEDFTGALLTFGE